MPKFSIPLAPVIAPGIQHRPAALPLDISSHIRWRGRRQTDEATNADI